MLGITFPKRSAYVLLALLTASLGCCFSFDAAANTNLLNSGDTVWILSAICFFLGPQHSKPPVVKAIAVLRIIRQKHCRRVAQDCFRRIAIPFIPSIPHPGENQ